MRKNTFVVFILFSVASLCFFSDSVSASEQDAAAALIERLIEKENPDNTGAAYLRKLTPHLFDYLRHGFPGEALAPLYQAGSLAELRTLLTKQVGPEVLDFGSRMFDFFEAQADQMKPVALNSWRAAVSDRFVFFYRPGSRAEEDADFISASSEETLSAIISSLDIESEAGRNTRLLHVSRPDDMAAADLLSTGRICVYLHPGRASAADQLKKSMGRMTFGATVLSEGEDKGAGRLTARIDVVYLNAFSLAVLHHEIAHAALFLGSFDAAPLQAKALRGEADLRKAFFAGYKPIPPFLQEGIGDYIFYYRVLYPRWPLLAPPAEIVRGLLASREFIPLKRLLKEGAAFRSQRRKAYSLEAATVVDFLLRTHGPAKLKAWFSSPEKDGARSFERAFGYSVEELESRWKASLLGEGER
ncbi:MAG: hypothetical protein A2Y56_03070 [Candidatus Aminicenantes bacterium RBG_13_63_10]|nr:MAG: hypothetical protein A2Y56_03070 [Candidatus Aminicenantes bacterium RBG_13_63_10]